ncbi:RNA helicase [Plakobranchus ocellatus]|uniref:RNA helicase n=1 Tax=Plakobranchus ocellatus TaxID=259542 RepID=A0AAV3YG94_9GAST|nr:RNA helicase [Plakobranchus ocellatus]
MKKSKIELSWRPSSAQHLHVTQIARGYAKQSPYPSSGHSQFMRFAYTNLLLTAAARAEKVRRLTVLAVGTSEEWTYFFCWWKEYKQATHLTGSDIVLQLLECCDEGLRKDLTKTSRVQAFSDKNTIFKNMKTLAVHQENIMVVRVQLQQMQQDRYRHGAANTA